MTSVTPSLNGKTILRFAHAYEHGGGTERYLDDLDRALLARNEMTIIRLHLTRNNPAREPFEEQIGRGRLILVPLAISPSLPDSPGADSDEHSFRFRLKQGLRDWVLYNPIVWRLLGAGWIAAKPLPKQPGQAMAAREVSANFFRQYRVDLVMMHFFGGADAEEVMLQAKQAGVPVALLNHFANDRFKHLAIRKHVMAAEGVAGVSGLDVPHFAQKGFTDLSDGIDTDFFRRASARPLSNPPAHPVILLPGRVIKEKGQMDLVKAAARLKQQGIKCSLAFAGRTDSSGFVEDLKAEIARSDLTEHVHFLGALDLESLRDWYAASTVAALPTYHHEGLPRVILEAQAMELPVLAYRSGGVAGGIEEGQTGFLFAPGEIAGLTDRLRDLLESPEKRRAIGLRGRQAAEAKFSLAALADRHERFYRKIISEFAARHAVQR